MFRKLLNLLGRGSSTTAATGFQPSLLAVAGAAPDPARKMKPHPEFFGWPTSSTPFTPPVFTNTARQTADDQGNLELGFIRREAVYSQHPVRVIGHEFMINNSRALQGDGSSPKLCRIHDELLLKSILTLDIHQLSGDELIFIRLNPATLDHALLAQLPGRKVVIAFHPGEKLTSKLLTQCRELKLRGFRFALDDYTFSPELDDLLDLVDFLRFDIDQNSLAELGPHLERSLAASEKILIGKNMHSREAHKIASCCPFTISRETAPSSRKTNR